MRAGAVISIARFDLTRAAELDEATLGGLVLVLDDDERARAARFQIDAERARYLVAHEALRRCLAGALGCPAGVVRFARGRFGKPRLAFPEVRSFHFNLSHSNTIALIAWSSAALGVDVEDIDHLVDPIGVGARVFSASEQRALLALPEEDRRAAFFDLWTRKEAVLKALGTGMAREPASVDLGLERAAAGARTPPYIDPVTGLHLFVSNLKVGPRHSAAVASAADFAIVSADPESVAAPAR